MAKKKRLGKKLRLQMRTKQNRRVPAWVMQRTARRFLRQPKQRHWRMGRLKV